MRLLVFLHVGCRAQDRRAEASVRLGSFVEVLLQDLDFEDAVEYLHETEGADKERKKLAGDGEGVVCAAENALDVVEVEGAFDGDDGPEEPDGVADAEDFVYHGQSGRGGQLSFRFG